MRRYRVTRVRTPRPPKPPKPKRPLVRELAALYKKLLTTDAGQRIATMVEAMNWFDQALPYVVLQNKGQLTPEQARAYDQALKCRQRGVGTTFNGEKETSFKMALMRYQNVCTSLKNLPKVETYYKTLDEQGDKLKEKEERLESKFGTILDFVSKAMKPTNAQGQPIVLKVGLVHGKPYQMDPEMSQLTFSKTFVDDLRARFRQHGPFNVVREMLDPLSRLAALEAEQDSTGNYTGRYVLSPKKQLPLMHQMLENFEDFAKTVEAPNRLVKKTSLVPTAPDGQPKPARTGRVGLPMGGKRETIGGGLFVAGSHRGLVYTILSDEKVHSLDELAKAIFPHNPKNWIPAVVEKGIKSGRYDVTWIDDKHLQLKFKQQPAQTV